VRTDEETGQTIIAGMGELHLEILVDRMQPRVQGRGQRRQAAGGLPRDHHQEGREGRVHAQEADRWFGPVRQASIIDLEPLVTRSGPARATSSSTPSPAVASRASTSRRSTQGIQDAMRVRRARRLPDGRREGHAARRRLPRRRLLGDGVQDRRLDGLQGGRSPRRSRCCSSR
jgi:hypothetical protein